MRTEAMTQAGKELYLPIVMGEGPSWGCQVDTRIRGYEAYLVDGMIYQTPARWNGLDFWFEDNVIAFGSNPFILGCKTTPLEHRLWPEAVNSPPKPESYGAFADFAVSLMRYRPWGIELYNEPDVPNRHVEDQNFYGGWLKPDSEDWFEAGLRYGAFTRAVYDPIKSGGAMVIAGALSGSRASLDFAKGMREAGFAADFVSFHTYITMEEDFGKGYRYAEELRNIVERPLIWNETNVLGDGSAEHRQRQADYCKHIRMTYRWEEITKALWYSLRNEWQGTEMVSQGSPTMAYEAWRS